MKKILSIILIVVLVLSMNTFVFADDETGGGTETGDGTETAADDDYNIGKYTGTTTTAMDGIGNKVIGAIKTAAIIIAIAILIYVGVKFMLAAPGAKADLKSSLIPYIVGAALIFLAVPIVTIIQSITKGAE